MSTGALLFKNVSVTFFPTIFMSASFLKMSYSQQGRFFLLSLVANEKISFWGELFLISFVSCDEVVALTRLCKCRCVSLWREMEDGNTQKHTHQRDTPNKGIDITDVLKATLVVGAHLSGESAHKSNCKRSLHYFFPSIFYICHQMKMFVLCFVFLWSKLEFP